MIGKRDSLGRQIILGDIVMKIPQLKSPTICIVAGETPKMVRICSEMSMRRWHHDTKNKEVVANGKGWNVSDDIILCMSWKVTEISHNQFMFEDALSLERNSFPFHIIVYYEVDEMAQSVRDNLCQ